MDKKDFVSLECAKLLKENGFKEKCFARYIDEELTYVKSFGNEETYETLPMIIKKSPAIYAPTLYHAQKWLRDNHNIHIEINVFKYSIWGIILYKYDRNSIIDYVYVYCRYQSYESALNAGIIEALKSIKQI